MLNNTWKFYPLLPCVWEFVEGRVKHSLKYSWTLNFFGKQYTKNVFRVLCEKWTFKMSALLKNLEVFFIFHCYAIIPYLCICWFLSALCNDIGNAKDVMLYKLVSLYNRFRNYVTRQQYPQLTCKFYFIWSRSSNFEFCRPFVYACLCMYMLCMLYNYKKA